MTVEDLELSHSIELEILINGKKSTLLTTVEKVIDKTVLLTPIRLNNKIVGFPPNCNVSLIYCGEEQAFAWHNVTVKAVRHSGEVYHSVTLITEAEPMNRRGSYRVYIGQDMLISTFTNEGPKSVRVHIKDLSESGFAFLSKDDFSVGRTIRLNLKLNDHQELRLGAQIVRAQELEEHQAILFGCKLLERSKLLPPYLMHLQQERQRKRMAGHLSTVKS